MRVITIADLLDTWEAGLTQIPARRALTLLKLIWPDIPVITLAQINIGRRDAFLLSLREQLFGSRVNGLASCPHCAEQIELTFLVGNVRAPYASDAHEVIHLACKGFDISYRLPNTADLLMFTSGEIAQRRNQILERCVLEVKTQEGADLVPLQALPPSVTDAIEQGMAEADPQSEVQISLQCPVCNHTWLQVFDVVTFIWTELSERVKRALREVHALASCYGWNEHEILSMSSSRRQMYLEMISAS